MRPTAVLPCIGRIPISAPQAGAAPRPGSLPRFNGPSVAIWTIRIALAADFGAMDTDAGTYGSRALQFKTGVISSLWTKVTNGRPNVSAMALFHALCRVK